MIHVLISVWNCVWKINGKWYTRLEIKCHSGLIWLIIKMYFKNSHKLNFPLSWWWRNISQMIRFVRICNTIFDGVVEYWLLWTQSEQFVGYWKKRYFLMRWWCVSYWTNILRWIFDSVAHQNKFTDRYDAPHRHIAC